MVWLWLHRLLVLAQEWHLPGVVSELMEAPRLASCLCCGINHKDGRGNANPKCALVMRLLGEKDAAGFTPAECAALCCDVSCCVL